MKSKAQSPIVTLARWVLGVAAEALDQPAQRAVLANALALKNDRQAGRDALESLDRRARYAVIPKGIVSEVHERALVAARVLAGEAKTVAEIKALAAGALSLLEDLISLRIRGVNLPWLERFINSPEAGVIPRARYAAALSDWHDVDRILEVWPETTSSPAGALALVIRGIRAIAADDVSLQPVRQNNAMRATQEDETAAQTRTREVRIAMVLAILRAQSVTITPERDRPREATFNERLLLVEDVLRSGLYEDVDRRMGPLWVEQMLAGKAHSQRMYLPLGVYFTWSLTP